MKDKVYMVLSVLGFVLICFIFVQNYDVKQDSKEFELGSYYVPTITSQQDSAAEIYQQISGSRAIRCPETSLSTYEGAKANIASMFNNAYPNKYEATMWMFPTSIVPNTSSRLSLDANNENYYVKSLNLGNQYTAASKVTVRNLYNDIVSDDEAFPIIAPFQFYFVNSNTDNDEGNGETIIIQNSKKNCKITFTNASNWFCAGAYGTTMTLGSRTTNDKISWEEHKGHHQTVIGQSANASVNGGGAGQVIGYATGSTEVLIEYLDGTDWMPISVDTFIKTSNK